MSKQDGLFISLEGPEGSGKTTQARLLAEYLSKNGIDVVKTREPGGVSIAEQLREMLLNPDNIISPRAELLLYAAGRAQHTEELIIPALKEGKYVICERYVHASIAYQGYGRGLDLGLIMELNRVATNGIWPDLTVILDTDVEKGLERVKQVSKEFDRLESENISFHRKVREGYMELAKQDPDIVVIDTVESIEDINKKIVSVLSERKFI